MWDQGLDIEIKEFSLKLAEALNVKLLNEKVESRVCLLGLKNSLI